jgi:1-deoxyxylulose-5-phosphate synthase
MENQYNLLKREEEREMLPMCADMGVGCVPYSPLGKGRLARPWGQHTQRGDTDHAAKSFDLDVDQPVVEAVHQVAGERGVPMAHIAMAWVLSKPVVTAPIVGATKPHHRADAAASHNVQLTEDEVRRLEAPYTTQPAYYWW